MIRHAGERDARAIAGIYAPFVTGTPASFELEAPTTDEIARRITASEPLYPWLVFESDGDVCAYAYAGAFQARPAYRPSVEVSVYVGHDVHGRGIGRALMEALLRELEGRGFAQALAGVTLPNDASVGMFEGLGFEHVGTFYKVGSSSAGGTTSVGGSAPSGARGSAEAGAVASEGVNVEGLVAPGFEAGGCHLRLGLHGGTPRSRTTVVGNGDGPRRGTPTSTVISWASWSGASTVAGYSTA
jgi:L-amino acid N-acyltransferase YncA